MRQRKAPNAPSPEFTISEDDCAPGKYGSVLSTKIGKPYSLINMQSGPIQFLLHRFFIATAYRVQYNLIIVFLHL